MIKTINLLIVIFLITVKADIPVHCVKHQIKGTWKLQVSKPVLNGKGPVPCGHDIPDSAETSYRAGQDSFQADSEFELNLNEDNSVNDNQNQSGKWTMIYDEGFEITFQNTKYFAFSKYSPTHSRDFSSSCGETLIGWFSNFNTGDRGCYKAYKVSEKMDDTKSLQQVSIVQPEYQEQKNKEQAEKQDVQVYISNDNQTDQLLNDQFLDDQLLDNQNNEDNSMTIDQEYQQNLSIQDDQYSILPTLGDDQLDSMTFTDASADSMKFTDSPLDYSTQVDDQTQSYTQFNDPELNIEQDVQMIDKQLIGDTSSLDFLNFLQKSSHQQIVDHINSMEGLKWKARMYPQFEGKSIKELNSLAGRRRYNQQSRKSSFAQIKSKTKSLTRFPSNFSWEQYLSESIQQESCGSCYAIATMEMLSARLKIQGEDVTLSPQYSLDCNYYNQGCDGGYPYLVEKFGQEQYLVKEEQYPYRAHNGKCKKLDFKQFATLYSVGDFQYVGGAYGMSDEEAIMEEIQNNGPVVMSFEPTQSFMYYGGGVFHSEEQSRSEWEKVDHSVLCYGWGEEDGEKYWLLQNSWGSDWGENGRFRMRRGVDDSAIESMAEAAVPIVIRNGGSSLFVQTNLRSAQ